MAVFCYPLAGRTIPGWSKMGKVERDILNTFVPLREECGKGVSACAHRDLCGGASGSTDTPPMPRVVLIPMPQRVENTSSSFHTSCIGALREEESVRRPENPGILADFSV